ncbi:hypothetical protein FZI85_15620 [Mycobacterium sp. CBMA293]|uniref:hypothetical protein n=1 Tax=unclassified Mycolicibacterium TaxID=2636767 RepID=UPI0012DF3FAE|nr:MULTISPECIES: hypothetical protein [unclassified Mycolicibacterium]MUL46837.1 hypothetical protein [Mycolicibacterium sp. CBMA 360]MUL57378.1 hypothetical protein [Mycolicibacterium sp. CBMA 335]MUL70418.1 hypothetical protein [Mycolicibacterium sp. CBMA 311]MUL92466.1 hypothetical protein [Mycolicibacterium sp. CBMA 230]MUM04387.1 hypothetical protein [Mycolicibacterium sp. CBMA 213]
MRITRTGTFAVLLLSAALALSGCGSLNLGIFSASSSSPVKGPPVPPRMVRHDVQQLIWTFPQLGKPDEAVWVTWSNSADPSLSGNVQWIDAVIKLPPAETGRLLAQYHPVADGLQPTVQKILQSELPAGPYLSGPELNKVFSSPTMTSQAYLDRDRNVLVLTATSSLPGAR